MSALEQVIPEGYKQTEVGVIPSEWEVNKVSKAFEICNTLRFPLSAKVRESMAGEYPYYGPTRIQDYINEYRIDGEYALIGEDGDHFLKFETVPQTQLAKGKFNVNNHAHVIKGKVATAEWFYLFFKHREITSHLSRQGAGRYKLNKATLEQLPCAIPPKQEQTAIANALSDVDALLTALEKLIAKKQAIKTATMQQLLTGKTRLPQFATYNEGEMQGQPKGTKPSELGEIPEDWDVYAIGALFSITAGGDLRKNQFSPIKTDKHPYPIYSNAITNKGLYGYCSSFDYDGECLTITARGGIGHAVERDESFCAIGRLLVLSPKQNTNCKYVAEFANQYIEFANESTGVPQLTAPQVAKYSIAMPVFEEQTAIATILSDMDNEIQTLEQRLAKTRQIKQGMMQALLTGRIRLPFNQAKGM